MRIDWELVRKLGWHEDMDAANAWITTQGLTLLNHNQRPGTSWEITVQEVLTWDQETALLSKLQAEANTDTEPTAATLADVKARRIFRMFRRFNILIERHYPSQDQRSLEQLRDEAITQNYPNRILYIDAVWDWINGDGSENIATGGILAYLYDREDAINAALNKDAVAAVAVTSTNYDTGGSKGPPDPAVSIRSARAITD